MSTLEKLSKADKFTHVSPQKTEGSLFSPVVDFLCLGGGFLLFMIPVLFISPTNEALILQISFAGLVAANFINHPHFAHSYQIFYRDFRWKAFSPDSPLRYKYVFAGIIQPLLMLMFFTYCMLTGKYLLLGFAGNLMVFFTGWHYVKQGYGMLMVSAVLKRNFFSELDKKLLLINAYLAWGFSWLFTNHLISERSMWGIEYFTFSSPEWLLWGLGVSLVASSLIVAYLFALKCRSNFAAFPKNGALVYIVSLYIWLILTHIHPALAMIIPGFHSLQYLVVVWRYELNKSKADYANDVENNIENPRSINRRFTVFIAAGILFGVLGFWVLPIILDYVISYEIEALANSAFIFMFWIFINIQHYFIDNVIWKKENKDISKYLFS